MNIVDILEKQKKFYESGATLPVSFRIEMLRKLYHSIQLHEKDIEDALAKDLRKSDFEGYMCEIGMTLSEISFMIKNVRKFAKDHKVRTHLSQFPAKSYTKRTPYGNVLIMSPWNYPFLLSMEPLVNALAAGNTAIVKPSAYSPETAKVVKKIIESCFPSEYVSVITGGRKENAELLDKKFDFIFFTGSQAVGKEVLRKAAEHLTPVVLELGGKSPCIVDETANIELAAKRIVFGKYLNCGQTCVAPDFVMCHRSVKDKLIQEFCRQINLQFGEDCLSNPDYVRLVNEKHFDRVLSLIDKEKIVYGGAFDRETLTIEPTVMDNVAFDDAVMQEEIFGPVLPVIVYDDKAEIYERMMKMQKPLAMYIFSGDKKFIKEITDRVSFGGGCINDTIIHLVTSNMPFGGVGESGMGAYHGKTGFDAFSHEKAIVDKKTWLDLPMRYQPYDRKKYAKALRLFMK